MQVLVETLRHVVETDPGTEPADRLMWVVMQGLYRRVYGQTVLLKREYKLTVSTAEQLAIMGWFRGVELTGDVWGVMQKLIA